MSKELLLHNHSPTQKDVLLDIHLSNTPVYDAYVNDSSGQSKVYYSSTLTLIPSTFVTGYVKA